jgi:hypothetical protein
MMPGGRPRWWAWRWRPSPASGRRLSSVVVACLWCWLGFVGAARAERVALLIGNDEGHGPDARLRYAERDAARLARLLSRTGGFTPEATAVRLGGTAADLRRTLGELAARLGTTPGEHLVLVYYSGHADGQNLHLGASLFPLVELRQSVLALPAAARVLILDACQAGVLTRAKGGQPGPGFVLMQGAEQPTRGLAILASSAASELAQESDQLGASVFTHYLHAGLAGLADHNRDGGVSLGEIFAYASERTLAATLHTITGPQHPTFRLDVSGTEDLLLTRPGAQGAGYGHVRMDVPGWYFIRRGDGTVVAELTSGGGEVLALDPGSYEITRRGQRSLEVAALSVREGEATAISRVRGTPVAFGRLVRKGGLASAARLDGGRGAGDGGSVSYGLSVAMSARTSIADLGPSLGATVAGRADLRVLSLELRLAFGRAQHDAAYLSTTVWETAGSLAVLRAHDVVLRAPGATLTVAAGIEGGLSHMAQRLDGGDRFSSWSPFVGPTAVAEMTAAHRFFVRAGIGVPIYIVRATDDAAAAPATRWRPAASVAIGGGAWF